jgi:hypothetical protein
MAKFDIPASPHYSYLDLNDLKGLDTMSTSPNYMRATDMLNLVKKDGVHRIRSSVNQTFRVADEPEIIYPEHPDYPDLEPIMIYHNFDIKFLGKIECVKDGKTIPYYVKIGEILGPVGAKNGSEIQIKIMKTPHLSSIEGGSTYAKYYHFTNYGETGNRNGLYESIEFDGKTWVFTPIGILTFKITDDYEWEVINVLDDPYVPLIGIGSYPDGKGYVKYESLNLLSDARRVRFRGDGTSTKFVLPEKNILADGISVHKLNGDELVDMDVEYTVDTEAGTVTFASALPKADGADNVEIRYRKDDTDYDVFDGYRASCTEKKFESIARWKILEEDTEHYKVQFDFSFKPGKEFIEGTDYIDRIRYKVYKGDEVILSEVEFICYINSKDDDLNTNYTVYIAKDVFDNDDLEWRISFNPDVITHENVKILVEGEGGQSSIQTSIDLDAKAIDDTGKDLSWMGIISGGDCLTRISGVRGQKGELHFGCGFGLLVSSESDLICPDAKVKLKLADTWIDFMTLNIDGSDTMYPTNHTLPSYSKINIEYKDEWGGQKIPFKWRIELNTYSEKEGRIIEYVDSETLEIEIPKISFPLTYEELEQYTTELSVTISDVKEIYDVSNIVESHRGKLSCYYFTKTCTVYGHESNRRVFVSDGSGTDTFSGDCLNEKPSIYYFPDDNYRVLGEDTEILGYAETDGKLLTFKRGDDSVYVRYGTTLDGQIQFPSMAVTKNLQIFTKPIQIGNEVLVITRDGIKSIIYVENECRTHLRSYFINSYFPLWRDYDYDKMQWYVEENMLHIFLDKYEFVADLNVKSYVAEGNTPGRNAGTSTLQFQYDWYVCKHRDEFEIPKVTVYQPKDLEQASKVPQDLTPIGYSNKAVYRFDWDGTKLDAYMDGEDNINYYPISAKFVTPFLDFGAINLAKTIKYVYINTRATDNSAYEIGYIDENGYTETMEKIYGKITDQKTRYKNTEVPFPKLIQIKSKIKKFMNIKLYIKNLVDEDSEPVNFPYLQKYGDMNFDRILIQYQLSGKYRGE